MIESGSLTETRWDAICENHVTKSAGELVTGSSALIRVSLYKSN